MTFKPDYRQPALKTFKLVWTVVIFSLTATVSYKIRVPSLSYSTMKIAGGLFIIVILWIYIFFQFERKNTYFQIKNGCITEFRRAIFSTSRNIKVSQIISIQIEQSIFERLLNLYHIKLKVKTTLPFVQMNFIINKSTADKLLPLLKINPRKHIKTMRFSFLRVLRHSFLTASPQTIITAAVSVFLLVIFREDAQILFGIGVVGAVIITLRALYIVFKIAFINFNFTFELFDNLIRLSKGLVFKNIENINSDNTCAYTIIKPLLARFFDFGYLKAIGVESKTVCLCVKTDRLYKLLPKEDFTTKIRTGIFKKVFLSENFIKIEKGIFKKQIMFIPKIAVEGFDYIKLPYFRFYKIKVFASGLNSVVCLGFVQTKNT
ncbi:MAG: PH domain-containing protein [Acutalibacteraceae bacterium]|nr:PH domain-containing protein [Acutalibacteraceae bacterium]